MKLLMRAPPHNQIFSELSPCVSVVFINQIFRRFNETLFNENCFKLQLSIFQLLSQHLIQIISNWMRKFPWFLPCSEKLHLKTVNLIWLTRFLWNDFISNNFNNFRFEKFSTYIQKENNFPKTFNLSEICFLKLSSTVPLQGSIESSSININT